jgi:membrane dipeptidase
MSLQDDAIAVDGLVVSRWSREVFESMRAGGITAANCTVAVWEGFTDGMANMASFKRWFVAHDDLIRPVRSVEDVFAAEREGRVGIILGWQNTSPIEDDLSRLALFHELGLRVAQLTYNTQNFVGSGCYESRDSGLSDFGRETVGQMNALGIAIDLSHVGSRTSRDAVLTSSTPVAYTHVCPAALKAHPRNKSDEELRLLADRGGMVGVTPFAWFLREPTLDAFLEAVEHIIGVAGEEHVGVGTDFSEGHGSEFLEWIMRDKGRGRLVISEPLDQVSLALPPGLERLSDWPNLTTAMERRGWSELRITRVLGQNWLRFFGDVWR